MDRLEPILILAIPHESRVVQRHQDRIQERDDMRPQRVRIRQVEMLSRGAEVGGFPPRGDVGSGTRAIERRLQSERRCRVLAELLSYGKQIRFCAALFTRQSRGGPARGADFLVASFWKVECGLVEQLHEQVRVFRRQNRRVVETHEEEHIVHRARAQNLATQGRMVSVMRDEARTVVVEHEIHWNSDRMLSDQKTHDLAREPSRFGDTFQRGILQCHANVRVYPVGITRARDHRAALARRTAVSRPCV